jgi:hypothetical protein
MIQKNKNRKAYANKKRRVMRGDGGEYDGAVTMGLNSNNSPLVRASHDGALRNEVLSDTV